MDFIKGAKINKPNEMKEMGLDPLKSA